MDVQLPTSMNHVKHGGALSRLTLGELPTVMRRQMQTVRKYRRVLEQAVMDVKNEVDLLDAHLIDEACAAEIHTRFCRWLLRNRLEKVTPGEITKCSESALRAKTIRNRAIARLGLNTPPPAPWIEAETVDSKEVSND